MTHQLSLDLIHQFLYQKHLHLLLLQSRKIFLGIKDSNLYYCHNTSKYNFYHLSFIRITATWNNLSHSALHFWKSMKAFTFPVYVKNTHTHTHKDNRKRIIGRSNKVLCSSDSSDVKKTSGGILWNIFAQSSEGYYGNNSLIIFNITIFQSCISPL